MLGTGRRYRVGGFQLSRVSVCRVVTRRLAGEVDVGGVKPVCGQAYDDDRCNECSQRHEFSPFWRIGFGNISEGLPGVVGDDDGRETEHGPCDKPPCVPSSNEGGGHELGEEDGSGRDGGSDVPAAGPVVGAAAGWLCR